MRYRFETLEDARKFASSKIKQAISVVEMPVDLNVLKSILESEVAL